MIARLLRRPDRKDDVYAEAQALVDDGLDLAFVLDLYPEDAGWLAPLLDTGIVIGESFAVDEPSYYFEASLKTRFVEAGIEKARRAAAPVSEPVAIVEPAAVSGPAAGGLMRLQGMMAGTAVAVVLGGMGVLTLGLVTADDSVPGDWNYAFKLAGERIDYALANDDRRTDLEIQQALVRLEELNELNERGTVSAKAVEGVRKEIEDVVDAVETRDLDPVQRQSAKAIADSAAVLLNSTKQNKPELAPQIDDATLAAAALDNAVTGIPVPSPTATPTEPPTESPTSTPTPTPTETQEGSETPETPIASETPAEETPEPGETETPAGTEVPGDATTSPEAAPSAEVTDVADSDELP